MDEYCQKLKDLAGQLEDVGYPVSEARLVLQLVRGLPPEYDTIASLINHGSYSWDDARGMLDLEKQRQAVRQQPNQSALVTPQNITVPTQNSSPPTPQPTPQNRPYDPNFQQCCGPGRGGNRGGRFNNRGGRRPVSVSLPSTVGLVADSTMSLPNATGSLEHFSTILQPTTSPTLLT